MPSQNERYWRLLGELRCVVCQNQSLADSSAGLASDLRGRVMMLMEQGYTDTQIKSYLVERYGEFILLKPRLQRKTYLLWGAPLLLVFLGALCLWFAWKKARQ